MHFTSNHSCHSNQTHTVVVMCSLLANAQGKLWHTGRITLHCLNGSFVEGGTMLAWVNAAQCASRFWTLFLAKVAGVFFLNDVAYLFPPAKLLPWNCRSCKASLRQLLGEYRTWKLPRKDTLVCVSDRVGWYLPSSPPLTILEHLCYNTLNTGWSFGSWQYRGMSEMKMQRCRYLTTLGRVVMQCKRSQKWFVVKFWNMWIKV